jgi:hypothetical protein
LTQCAAVKIHELDIIDPPQRYLSLIEIDTAQFHVAALALSPPTIRVIDTGLAEHPHDTVVLHE